MTKPVILCHQPLQCWHNGNMKGVASYLGRGWGYACAPNTSSHSQEVDLAVVPVKCPICQQQRPIQTLQYCTIPSWHQFPIEDKMTSLDLFHSGRSNDSFHCLKQVHTLDSKLSFLPLVHLSTLRGFTNIISGLHSIWITNIGSRKLL